MKSLPDLREAGLEYEDMEGLQTPVDESSIYLHAHPGAFSSNIRAVEDAFEGLASCDEVKAITIDLSDVLRLDSRGLRTLVDLKKRLDERGGQLSLANVPAPVRRLLEYARLDRYFSLVSRSVGIPH